MKCKRHVFDCDLTCDSNGEPSDLTWMRDDSRPDMDLEFIDLILDLQVIDL